MVASATQCPHQGTDEFCSLPAFTAPSRARNSATSAAWLARIDSACIALAAATRTMKSVTIPPMIKLATMISPHATYPFSAAMLRYLFVSSVWWLVRIHAGHCADVRRGSQPTNCRNRAYRDDAQAAPVWLTF